jgi:hypothetical protein
MTRANKNNPLTAPYVGDPNTSNANQGDDIYKNVVKKHKEPDAGPTIEDLNKKEKKEVPLSFVCTESTNVRSAKFEPNKDDGTKGKLTVFFHSAGYYYENVPMEMWNHFRTFMSKGIWVNSYLVGSDRKNPIFKGTKIVD